MSSSNTAQVDPSPASDNVRQVLETIASIAAPFTAVTVFLYYFAWVRTGALFSYFGIEQKLLGYSGNDYLLRSTTVALRPAAILVLVVTLACAISRSVLRLDVNSKGRRAVQPVVLAVSICILLPSSAVLLGLIGTQHHLLYAVGLGVGALSAELAVAFRVGQTVDSRWVWLRRGLVAAAVAVSVFWGCAIHARQAGEMLARSWEANPRLRPSAIVYSTKDLELSGPGVAEEQLGDRVNFCCRYAGLRVLTYSNQRWFLIPVGWRSNNGASAFILPDDSGVRVEVGPPSQESVGVR
jgi:hypothetical protein